MIKITFVTCNNTKLLDAQNIFSLDDIEIIGKNIDLQEIQSQDQKEIIKYKAQLAFNLIKGPTIVDDTCFYINSYPGFPGTLTKYVNLLLGLDAFLRLYDEGQRAYFQTMLCYKDFSNEIITEGSLEGRLTKNRSKIINKDTPLNSIFIPKGFNEPLIELPEELGLRNIHRIKALKELKKALTETL